MDIFNSLCPNCYTDNKSVHTTYAVQCSQQTRCIFRCRQCKTFFSETAGTLLAGLRTPLSRIAQILSAVHDGLGINATCRVFHTSKNSIKKWESALSSVKKVLLLYTLCHQFLQLCLEGDELYTKIDKNRPPADSEG